MLREVRCAACATELEDRAQGVLKRADEIYMGILGGAHNHMTPEDAIPQPIGDQWWFLDCAGVPEELPRYLDILE